MVYSLLSEDSQIARELYLQIAGNEASFAELASRFSEGRERNTNGIVGPVPHQGSPSTGRETAHKPCWTVAGTLLNWGVVAGCPFGALRACTL